MFVQFAGDGYHQFEISDGAQIVMPINYTTAKTFDGMFQSEEICDYTITFDWKVTCCISLLHAFCD